MNDTWRPAWRCRTWRAQTRRATAARSAGRSQNATVELHYGHFSFDGKLFEATTMKRASSSSRNERASTTRSSHDSTIEKTRVTKTATPRTSFPLPPAKKEGLGLC